MDEDYYLNVYSLPDTCKKGPLTFVKTGETQNFVQNSNDNDDDEDINFQQP